MIRIKALLPLFDRVLVERVAPQKEVKGILLPDSAAQKVNVATVLEVGPGKKTNEGKTIPLQVKKGDKVVVNEWAGTPVTMNEKTLQMIKEEDILGIVELE